MKKQQKNSASAFALRIALALALTSISAILLASTLRPPAAGPQPDRPAPDVVAMVGPVSQDLDLRALPYIPVNGEEDEVRLTRHPFPLGRRYSHQPPSNRRWTVHSAVDAACAGANSQHAFSNTDVRRDELNPERVRLPSARFRWRRGTEPLHQFGQFLDQNL